MEHIEDIKAYAEEKIAGGEKPFGAVKVGKIEVWRATEDFRFEVYASGHVETTETAKVGDLIAVTVDQEWNRYKTGDSKNNMWIISDSVLTEKYTKTESGKNNEPIEHCEYYGAFEPKGGVQEFIVIHEEISFNAPWGELQNIYEGGVLNVTNLNDIYGINKDEFKETYTPA